ncbi:ubiquinone/menaquinone biosynthesis methyltransferase [Acanthopleuribacter pedis]|uniref:Demethylmenaquinone methyltransferase n=1 Tax=Acanthopleuribacter pedis TaxID=442870 RepID=A0A8J7QM64_9BACT|nr:ubiquinone/menaquinone biosynthesis methyltransferase [Acanthopleuribacter pedis]MBO1322130.1 ubiquinone/menaquinone biosynthesis methyltransferase [Acanthopleuribacter pedis]
MNDSYRLKTDEKGARIQKMFDGLAANYDLMNRIMTMGQDQRWRRYVVDQAGLKPGCTVLDLAAGTGDIAFEVRRRFDDAAVIAGDFSLGMMAFGTGRKGGDGVHWVACDALALPFADNSFDAVLFGYLLRNVTCIQTALSEIRRVLKPGGKAVCLDTTPPPPGLLRPFIKSYLNHGLPLLGRALGTDPSAYAYLSNSTQHFETAEALADHFLQAEFDGVGFRHFLFKTIAVHWASKQAGGRQHNTSKKDL